MSPEQARGQANVDSRSDVWSFCVVVYEAVTGHPPFEAENYNALMRLIVETEPPTLHDLGATDGALSAIIAKGLTKDVSERWSSLGLLGKALATWLYEQGIGEDACGASLEARWLARPTDPSPGRFSSSVPPFNRLEPRTGSRDRIASAPTIVSRSAGTPHSLSQTQERGSSRSRRALTVLGIVAAGVTAYAALRPTPSGPPHSGVAPETVRLGVAPSSPGLASPEPPPSATATLSAAPAPAIAASAPSPEPGRSGSPHARKLQPAAPPPPLPAAPAPVPTPAPPAPTGASDLLSPY
jgi:serine/threonine-protein kinase